MKAKGKPSPGVQQNGLDLSPDRSLNPSQLSGVNGGRTGQAGSKPFGGESENRGPFGWAVGKTNFIVMGSGMETRNRQSQKSWQKNRICWGGGIVEWVGHLPFFTRLTWVRSLACHMVPLSTAGEISEHRGK